MEGDLDATVDMRILTDMIEQKFVWNYLGSITKPPCNEHVNWCVLRKIEHISEEQVAFFTARLAEDPGFAEGRGNNRES